jgi:hypothetical protein
MGGHVHITDSNGNPSVFNVKRNDDGKRWLNANYANPENRWNLDNVIVVVLRNSLHSLPNVGRVKPIEVRLQ